MRKPQVYYRLEKKSLSTTPNIKNWAESNFVKHYNNQTSSFPEIALDDKAGFPEEAHSAMAGRCLVEVPACGQN